MLDVVLNAGRDKPLRRRHPWVLSGAIREVSGAEQAAGAWARVISAEGETLGWGHFSPASGIRVRILSFGKDEVGDDFVGERVVQAWMLRTGQRTGPPGGSVPSSWSSPDETLCSAP